MSRWLRRILDSLMIAYVGYAAWFWLSGASGVRLFSLAWFGLGVFVVFAAVVANLSILGSGRASSLGLAYLVAFLIAWFLVMPLELLHNSFLPQIAPVIAFAAVVNWRSASSGADRASN